MTTHADDPNSPTLRSGVESAERPGTDFPIQNLPLGVYRARGSAGAGRIGVAIGDEILDLADVVNSGLIRAELLAKVGEAVHEPALNALLALGRPVMAELRGELSRLLRADAGVTGTQTSTLRALLTPMREAEMLVPVQVGDYTDFYASVHHATNVGSMFRPDNALLPNYKHVPIGYHGRASSIVAHGTPVRRPSGQTRDDANAPPVFGPTRRLDYELEVGIVIGAGNTLGTTVPIARAEEHVAGLCLVNDWSARDVQAWEYQPLGPFLAKNFATTVSPWVVTLDALAPFRAPAYPRPAGDPAPLPYLHDQRDQASGAVDITLEVWLRTAAMRDSGHDAARVSRCSFTMMYWTAAQLVTHHASNGCNLRPGDLLASGTVSGPTPGERGCLLERTWRGSEPLTLPSGEVRRFLEDGDEVILRGYCEREGYRRIGLGDCAGLVLPAQ